jgi:hypothetical protein
MLCCLLSSTLLLNIDTLLRYSSSFSYILSPSLPLSLPPPLPLSLFRYLFPVSPSLACGSSGIDVSCNSCYFFLPAHTGLALSVQHSNFFHHGGGPGLCQESLQACHYPTAKHIPEHALSHRSGWLLQKGWRSARTKKQKRLTSRTHISFAL